MKCLQTLQGIYLSTYCTQKLSNIDKADEDSVGI